tara:strand:- start:160 stop:753 length:594 start_codon:yes stop_codon:yes gene_type:complete
MKKLFLLTIAVAAFVISGSSMVFAAQQDVETTGQAIASPYWQAEADNTYTFLGIANPSISGNISRAVTVRAIQGDGTTGDSATFTVALGQTAKVFIIGTNHSTVNSSTVTDTSIQWISETGYGYVVVRGAYITVASALAGTPVLFPSSTGYAGILSVWGAIVKPGGTGFAMEFIGDLTDSIAVSTGLTGNNATSGGL